MKMTDQKITVSIAGGTGYTAGELLRILCHHPNVTVESVSSTSASGKPVHSAHPDLEGLVNLRYDANPNVDTDVLFLCLGHGVATQFLSSLTLKDHQKIIDLSNEFRLKEHNRFANREFVYGLPELHRDKIKKANNIANPGCFATTIQLALLPLAAGKKLSSPVHINAITGSTGAGAKLSATSHFSWRNNNVSVYKAFTHQHIAEIEQSLNQLHENYGQALYFIPVRGNFTRGIFATIYLQSDLTETDAQGMFRKYYQSHPFVTVTESAPSLKSVVNTNRCFLHVQKIKGMLLITGVTDNLIKGASGQAVQNMNLMFGLPETTGLQLKPTML